MIYALEIKEEAYRDIQDAYNYYESKQIGLGDRFVEELEEKINYIQVYPLHFREIEDDFRQVLIDIFPYQIIYEFNNTNIIIYSVFNAYQNPENKPPKNSYNNIQIVLDAARERSRELNKG